VTLVETGYSNDVDNVTAGPGGPQIVSNPSDPIGQWLFPGESVSLQNLQIVATLEGGGPYYSGGSAPSQCSAAPGCTLWGSVADNAQFQFSGLSFGSPNVILQNVLLTSSNVYGVQIADVTATSFDVIFGSAGFPNYNNGPDFGTFTLDLQTTTVPLPSSLLMLLGGLLLFLPFRKYQRMVSSIRS
jgi:hypothetical protein